MQIDFFVILLYSTLGSLFLNRTLLGGVELLQSKLGSYFCHFIKLGLLIINRTLLGGVEYTIVVI
jgi:hypothetical protein